MNNLKKIGLTALAASLVTTSAFAGEMSVAGSASIGVKNTTGTNTALGKSWTMGNQLTFTGGGELDNGMNVSLSFIIDQADDSTTGLANSPFDSHSVTISSDARLKTNIEVITNALATIMQINGVTYNWSEEMLRMSPSKSGQTGYGFIAQELEKVLPHLVKTGDYKSIQYDGLIPILLQAIKELYLEIEKLKKNS